MPTHAQYLRISPCLWLRLLEHCFAIVEPVLSLRRNVVALARLCRAVRRRHAARVAAPARLAQPHVDALAVAVVGVLQLEVSGTRPPSLPCAL